MYNPQVSSNNNQLKDITERLNSNFDIGILVYLFHKSRFWIICFFVASFICGYLYLRYSNIVYESRAIIQIADASKDNLLRLNNIDQGTNVLAEAVEQLKSKIFLKNYVVENLDISVNYFSQGTFKSNDLYNNSPYKLKVNVKNKGIYGNKIVVQINKDLKGGALNFGNRIEKFEFNKWLKLEEFDINIYLNPEMSESEIFATLEENKGLYFTLSDIDVVTAQIASKLEIKITNEYAKTLMIRVKDFNPTKSSDIVNAVIEEYLTYDITRKSESSRKILDFIESQLGNVYNELRLTESDLQKFRKEKNIGGKETILNSELARYSKLEDQLLQIELDEKIIEEIQNKINAKKSIDIYELISLISGTEYEDLIKEITQSIQKLLLEKENMLYSVTPNSKQIEQINYQIENQRKLLIESLNSVKIKYRTKYKNLLEKSSSYKSKFNQNPEDEVEFSRLTRLYSINEKYYTLLLEKKTEYSISKASAVSKNVILEKAQGNGVKISPSTRNTILISFLSGLLLSAALLFIRYIFHDKIYTLSDITKYSSGNVALLGIVPKYPNNIPVSQLIVDKNPKALISEAFRTIRTNLGFISNTAGSKIISITSTISGEGKTFVAINIAGILAFTGKKVIIIDLDMRKPKIHKGFGVTNNIGMSTILTNTSSIEECYNLSPMENLKFITAGPSPPNPSELIMSSKLNEVIEYLKKEFDYIVIDNAPIGLVTDGIVTIQKADFPIYVFRAGYSKKMFTQILDKLKNESKIKNLSVVLNDVDISRKIYSYNYGYGYGYGYGGGYGGGYYTDEEDFKRKSKKKS
ncbi:MAG: polysaccharide biosynthesis tyrosine autokinase [Sphingobacteriaceae bacterium]|nr:polysaccharide biosynthesis tyrosine autokinase [Sphingobacteriaceae bacterium]